MQYNLDHAIYDAKQGKFEGLTEEQAAAIFSMVAKGCREKTKKRLASRLAIPLSLWTRYGIYSRIVLTETGADYICGQSWNDEMRTLRECILN
jgi:hypothetical protein